MRPRKQEKLVFNNKANCIVDFDELERAMLWCSNSVIKRKRTIYIHGKYPCVSVYEKKIHVHRLLMCFWNNRILLRKEYVHHKDGNKLNSLKNNLEIMIDSNHQSLHNKGKKLSKDHKIKISIANKNRKGLKYKYARDSITEKDVFDLKTKGYSFSKISKNLNLNYYCVIKRYENYIHEHKHLLK